MDSNRRHQLAQNDLANWFIAQYEDWIEPNKYWLSWVLFIVLVLIAGVLAYSTLMSHTRAKAWQEYYSALYSPDAKSALESVADSNGMMADRARLTLAQIQLTEVSGELQFDQKQAVEKLDKTIEHFRQIKETAKDAEFQRQASWGLAQSLESAAAVRTGNDLEEAKKEYKTLAERCPNEFLGKKAAKQLAFISRPDTATFFEKSVAKANEAPKAEDFKVDIDKKDPFDAGSSPDLEKMLGGEFSAPITASEETKTPEKTEKQTEEPSKENLSPDKPQEKSPSDSPEKTEEKKE